MFRQDFSCPALLEDTCPGFPYGAVTRCGPPFQAVRLARHRAAGLIRFRSPLLAEPQGRPKADHSAQDARVDVLSSRY